MKISCFTGGAALTNGYLVESAEGNFLVDAPNGIAEWVAEKGVRVDSLYLTHQHYDHVEDAAKLRASGIKVHAWAEYSKSLTLESYGSSWGLPEVVPFTVDQLIPAGEVKLFGTTCRVAHVPGHSKDSIAFILEDEGVVFSGDALFAGSVGRCDLPGGNFELLVAGVQRELLTLDGETEVLSGHGPATTISHEKLTNPYLK